MRLSEFLASTASFVGTDEEGDSIYQLTREQFETFLEGSQWEEADKAIHRKSFTGKIVIGEGGFGHYSD